MVQIRTFLKLGPKLEIFSMHEHEDIIDEAIEKFSNFQVEKYVISATKHNSCLRIKIKNDSAHFSLIIQEFESIKTHIDMTLINLIHMF